MDSVAYALVPDEFIEGINIRYHCIVNSYNYVSSYLNWGATYICKNKSTSNPSSLSRSVCKYINHKDTFSPTMLIVN